jgi:hypothetical protein
MKKIIAFTLLFVIPVGMSTGCGQSGISVFSVSGDVFYGGSPVGNALVSFVPYTPDGRGASATTDENGTFTLMTQGATKNGAMTGTYFVLVSKWIEIDERRNEVKRQVTEYVPNAPPEKRYQQKNLLPSKYEKAETTDLTVTVERKNNHFTLELKD